MQKIYTHYDNLKVARNAPPEVIKAAYKTLSQKYHPDRNSDDPDAARIMAIINASYEVLSDPEKREKHDIWIAEQESSKTAQNNSHQHTPPNKGSTATSINYKSVVSHISSHWVLYGFIVAIIWVTLTDQPSSPRTESRPYIANPASEQPAPMKKWSDVTSDPRFQSASPELKERIRNDFFEQVIMPDIPENMDVEKIRAEFNRRATIPSAGEIVDGYRFKGGNPNDESNWEPESAEPSFIDKATSAANPTFTQKESKAVSKITSSVKNYAGQKQPAYYERPLYAPNGEAWPKVAGYVKGYKKLNTNGLSSVTVDNSQNDSDVFVKLVSLNGEKASPARQFFIPAYGKFTVNKVTAGSYDVRYRDLSSGSLSRSESFNLEETEIAGGTQFSNYTMTLYKVRNGNMQTYGLSETEF